MGTYAQVVKLNGIIKDGTDNSILAGVSVFENNNFIMRTNTNGEFSILAI